MVIGIGEIEYDRWLAADEASQVEALAASYCVPRPDGSGFYLDFGYDNFEAMEGARVCAAGLSPDPARLRGRTRYMAGWLAGQIYDHHAASPSAGPEPKRARGPRRQPDKRARFVDLWESSESLGGVAAALGLKTATVRAYASRFRAAGVRLKKFKTGPRRGQRMDDLDAEAVAELNRRIARTRRRR